jgi:hypothetical protein
MSLLTCIGAPMQREELPGPRNWQAAETQGGQNEGRIFVPRPISSALAGAPFDSKWVPPVAGAPSRHTGTGGAADGVHAQCLRDSGAGDRSRVVPRAAARRSRVVPRSKQLGSQARRCRAERAAGQAARRGDAEQPRRCAGRQAGAHRRGEDSPATGLTDLNPIGGKRLRSMTYLQGDRRFYFKNAYSGCVFGALA